MKMGEEIRPFHSDQVKIDSCLFIQLAQEDLRENPNEVLTYDLKVRSEVGQAC